MSFAEKNKAWLLPLLGLGVAGVVFMNIKLFTGDKPAAAQESQAPQAAASPAVPEAPPPVAESAPDTSGDLWADLRAYAKTPENLTEDKALRDRSRVRVGQDLETPSPSPLPRPSTNLEGWIPLRKAAEKGTQDPSPLVPAPEVEFLVHGPSGARAWFDGQGFRQGESLPGLHYSVEKIGSTSVELKGPKGKTTQSTHPIHKVGAESPAREETP